MRVDLTMDSFWGSCGKGGISGWLAVREKYDTVVCSYGTQAGHTYNNAALGIKMMVQQLPVGIICPTVKNVLIGPGALIHAGVLLGELERYGRFLEGKRLMIHEHAAVVTDEHSRREYERGQTKMGSTAKGVGQAMIDRILRDPDGKAVAKFGFKGTPLEKYVVGRFEYDTALGEARDVLVEGAQGFGLSMYHGDYPFCTSRDVTPWQIAADCGLPWEWIHHIKVIDVMRTYPIRVNNRDGSSGPAYEGQKELTWEEVGQNPELTTVTKLPRRIFEFSRAQVEHAAFHCHDTLRTPATMTSGPGNNDDRSTEIAITFADYCKDLSELVGIIDTASKYGRVSYVCFGPDDADIIYLRGVPYGNAMHSIIHRFEEVSK